MKTSDLLWTFLLTLGGILGFNMIIRVVTKGWDVLLDLSWPGVAIAAVVATLVTLRRADRERETKPEF